MDQYVAQCHQLPLPGIPKAPSFLPESSLFESSYEPKQKNIQSFIFRPEKETPNFMNSFLHMDVHHLKG